MKIKIFMRSNNFSLFFLIMTIFSIIACGNKSKSSANQPFGDCKYGPPKAIFSDEIPKVSSHEFQLNPQTAVENVIFSDKLSLELIQSGCEKPIQEFRFTLPFDSKGLTDENWIDLSIDMFSFMGGLSESLQPFLFWFGALKDLKGQLKLGLPHELEQGRFVKLDKIASGQQGILIIILYQE